MIIATGNMKGGVGKSTLVKIMANHFCQTENVLVIETDSSQGSIKERRITDIAIKGEDFEFPYDVNCVSPKIALNFIKKIVEDGNSQWDKIFIDLPGGINLAVLPELLIYSDFIITPCRPGDDDFLPTLKYINFVHFDVYQDTGLTANVIGIFNQTSSQSKVLKSRQEYVRTSEISQYVHFLSQNIPSAEAKFQGNISSDSEEVQNSGINTYSNIEYKSGREQVDIIENICKELEDIFINNK